VERGKAEVLPKESVIEDSSSLCSLKASKKRQENGKKSRRMRKENTLGTASHV
jgi:hypothetical protein